MISPPPNRPRQNRMVQGSNGNSRVKNGAVLQATAAAITSAMPTRRSECGCGMSGSLAAGWRFGFHPVSRRKHHAIIGAAIAIGKHAADWMVALHVHAH